MSCGLVSWQTSWREVLPPCSRSRRRRRVADAAPPGKCQSASAALAGSERCNPDPARAPRASACGPPKFGVGMAPRNGGSEDKMKNYLDGGEAILEAFRKLKIDYIM